MTKLDWFLAGAVLLTLMAGVAAYGELSTVVQPGYQFSEGERPTVDKLNRLGQPTITVSGTLDGTAGLALKSVTGELLADSVVDGTTIKFNTNSPRQIMIGAVAGDGLTGGNGSALAVAVDNTTIQITDNKLGLKVGTNTTLAAGALIGTDASGHLTSVTVGHNLSLSEGTLNATFNRYDGAGQGLPNKGLARTWTHGIKNAAGADVAPGHVRVVLRCIYTITGTTLGYAVNNEIDISAALRSTDSKPAYTVVVSPTTIKVYATCDPGNVMLQDISDTAGSFGQLPNAGWWNLVVYASE